MTAAVEDAPPKSPIKASRITLRHVSWALGAFMTSVLVNSVGLLHMRFMTDSLAIGAGVAGALVGASKLYDAVFDPIMGSISDRTTSRWGPRRPYLLGGTFLCAAALLMLFLVPHVRGLALIAYVGGGLLVYSTAYTLFRIPYLAMAADLTFTFEQRSTLITWNVFGSSAGSLAATTLAPFLLADFGGDRAAHGSVAIIMSGLILLGGLGCFALTPSSLGAAAKARARHVNLLTSIRELSDNPAFLALIGYKVILFTGLTLQGVAVPFFTRYALHLSDRWLGWMFLAQTIAMVASQPLWRFLAGRYGRRNTAGIATLTATVVFGAWMASALVDPHALVLILGAAQGVATGGLFFSIQTMLPDTMEYDRQVTGLNREGMFAGVFVMVEKLTNAAAIAIFGTLMGALGYLSSADGHVAQPKSAIAGLYLIMAGLPMALALLSLVVLKFYRLDGHRFQASSDGGAEAAP